MKATKLKNGKWRARYVDHYEYDATGKRKVISGSVTADTEREAIKKAMRLEKTGQKDGATTVSLAISNYIKLKEGVLSPTTIRAYKSLSKNAFNDISSVKLSELTTAALQAWVSKYATTHKPKATANAYGLLMASVSMYLPDARFRVSLPRRMPAELYTPTEADVKALLEAAQDTPKLYKALILATYGLRRGEICALTVSDIDAAKSAVRVSKDMVRAGKGKWTVKEPKTPQSVRFVTVAPDALRALLSDVTAPDGQIIDYHPDALTNAFRRLCDAKGLPRFRLHDLRAFSASLQHSMGIPDQYIMKTHGWKTDTVLKQVYRRTMADKEAEYTEKVINKMSLFVPTGSNKRATVSPPPPTTNTESEKNHG